MGDVKRRLQRFEEDLGSFPLERPKSTRWPLLVGAGVGVVFMAVAITSIIRPTSDAPPPARQTAVDPPPREPLPVTPEAISIQAVTIPPGAWVYDEAGTRIGQTPYTLEHVPPGAVVTLHFELKGYEPLTRQFSSKGNLSVELPLKRLATSAPKRDTKAVTDGVLDPF